MTLISRLNLFKERNKKNIPSKIRVGEIIINSLEPLGGMFKPGITKAGRLSLSGKLENGTKVKVYEAFNSSQIDLRLDLGEYLKSKKVLLPEVIGRDDHLVVEKWIEGQTLAKLKSNEVKKHSTELINFLEKIHFDKDFLTLAGKYKNCFCYLKDYLLLRLKPWEKWEPVETLLAEWIKSDSETNNIINKAISHPDLSLNNIIFNANKSIYIIDNELVGAGKGWILDHRNSFFRNKKSISEKEPMINNFYNLSWQLRLVGSAIDHGDFSRAERLAKIREF